MICPSQLCRVEQMAQDDCWIKASPETLPPHLLEVDVFIEVDNCVERGLYVADEKQWYSAHDVTAYPAGVITYWRKGSHPGGRSDRG